MSLRIPQNQIIFKYTIGKEYIYQSTYREYQGHYYELNGKTFAGKEFNIEAPLLIKRDSDKVNPLLLNSKTSTYGKILKKNILADSKELKSIPLNIKVEEIKYLAKEKNSNPIRIIFISKEDYKQNKDKNPLYTFTFISYNPEWGFTITDQNRKDIPEIDLFLDQYSNNSKEN